MQIGKFFYIFAATLLNYFINEKTIHFIHIIHTYSIIHLDAIKFATSALPKVTTNAVTNITATSAVCGGNVTENGNSTITARGVCWSTSENPTIESNKTTDGTGTGSFASNITGCIPKTLYNVRAYASNGAGTAYGEQVSFTMLPLNLPTVTTNNVTDITSSSAKCGGNVTSDGNSSVTARGVCWSTSQNPTINDKKTTNGAGTGSFTSNITGLAPNTTYYVKAYATSDAGTAYGTERVFTPKFVVGEEYQGGIVAYVDATGMHGFIAAPDDEWYIENYSVHYTWDWSNIIISTGATGTAIGTGKSNTNKIIQAEGQVNYDYAAKRCNMKNDYSGWFLPSKDELNELYKKRNIIGNFIVDSSDRPVYWSSSEFDNESAWYQDFYDSEQEIHWKRLVYKRVRCIREF